MGTLSKLLLDKAEEIRLSSPIETAVELMKEAGVSEDDARVQIEQHLMEKEATDTLVSSGVDVEKAVSLVKAANLNIKDLVTYQTVSDVHPSVELLKQAAAYIDAIESELADISERAAELEKEAAENIPVITPDVPEAFQKGANAGAFTHEDLVELQSINPALLTKIASSMEEPWGIGQASGEARPASDPILDFIYS